MGKNKIRDLLHVSVPSPKRSTFDRSHTNPITADVGYIYPVLVDELLPTDYVKLDLMAFAQTNPLTKPLLGRFTMKFEAFFVPLRLYSQNLDLNNVQPDFSDDFGLPFFTLPSDTEHPTIEPDAEDELYVHGTSLLSYLNMLPAKWTSSSVLAGDVLNGVPFIGYFDIYRNFYANPQDRSIPFRVGTRALTSGISYDVQDHYVDLSQFDTFISTLTRNSINDDGEATPQSVFEVFQQAFRNTNATGNTVFTSAPPLFNGQLWNSANQPSGPMALTLNALHLGLLRRTYNDDYFTAFFSNDFVNYQESTARVVVNNNVVTVNQLRLANRVAKYVDRSILSGTRYGDWLDVHFGAKTDTKLCIPQFLGSLRVPLVFNDVVSQTQSGEATSVNDNTTLGSRGSLGQGFKDFSKGSWLRFEAKEHGYLMIMCSIVPNVCYTRGIPKMYRKTRFADIYVPEMDAVGYQDLSEQEFNAVTGSDNSIAKQPSWFEYMVDYDKAHGLFVELEDYRQWLLIRDPLYFAYADKNSSSFNPSFSTYVLPELYNQVFAVQKEMDNFQIQLRFDYKIKRPISKQVLPRM